MPTIDLTLPKGEIPAADDKNLPVNAASFAQNAYLGKGRLEPYKNKDAVAATLTGGMVQSIMLYEGTHWFAWNDVVHAVKSPMAQDQYRRVYFTDDSGAKVTSNLIATGSPPFPASDYDLGVPAPDTAIGGTVNGSGGDPDDYSDDETRYYVMTYVTGYGEEGPPSPVSMSLELAHPDDTVSLVLPVPITNTSNLTHKRIYRTATGTTTEFLMVAEVPLSQVNFTDNIAGDELISVLETADYHPPMDGAKGMAMLAGGSVAVFAGNALAISEPFLPYAFPFEYRHSTEYDIVAIAPTRTGLAVLTEGVPYILSGGHPSAMAMEELDVRQSCVSARSVVDMGDTVLYASPDGLVAVSEGGARLLTKDIVTKYDWAEFLPETIHAYRYEGKYIAFYGDTSGDGSGIAGFIFDPYDGSLVRINDYATAGYSDLKTDTLYLVLDGQINKWDSGANPLTFVWRSKIYEMPEIAFDSMRVSSPDPTKITLKVWVDGAQVLNVPSLPCTTFKLPSIKGREWQYEVSGTGIVSRVTLATSMSEL